MKCFDHDCKHDGIWMPMLLFRRIPKSKPLVSRMIELGLCERHKESADIKMFLGDEGWTKIEKFLRENGFQKFKKNLTQLDWKLRPEVPVYNPDADLPF